MTEIVQFCAHLFDLFMQLLIFSFLAFILAFKELKNNRLFI